MIVLRHKCLSRLFGTLALALIWEMTKVRQALLFGSQGGTSCSEQVCLSHWSGLLWRGYGQYCFRIEFWSRARWPSGLRLYWCLVSGLWKEKILKSSTALRAVDHGGHVRLFQSLEGFFTYAEDGPSTRYYWSIVRSSFPLLCHVETGTRVSVPVSRFLVQAAGGASPGDVDICNTNWGWG